MRTRFSPRGASQAYPLTFAILPGFLAFSPKTRTFPRRLENVPRFLLLEEITIPASLIPRGA